MMYEREMHVGIDDIGTLGPGGGIGYVAAAVVRPGRSEQTRELLRKWERNLPPDVERRAARSKVTSCPTTGCASSSTT
jgi:hypothetical protein